MIEISATDEMESKYEVMKLAALLYVDAKKYILQYERYYFTDDHEVPEFLVAGLSLASTAEDFAPALEHHQLEHHQKVAEEHHPEDFTEPGSSGHYM